MVIDRWPRPPPINSTFTGCDLRSLCLMPMIGAVNGTWKSMKKTQFLKLQLKNQRQSARPYLWEGEFVCFHSEDGRWHNNIFRSNFFAVGIAPGGNTFSQSGRSDKTENHKYCGVFHFDVLFSSKETNRVWLETAATLHSVLTVLIG